MKHLTLMMLILFGCGSVVGCETLNVGTDNPHTLQITLSAPVGTGPNAPGLWSGESATFSATTTEFSGPFEFDWNFGGAAANTTSRLDSAGTTSVGVTFVDLAAPSDFTATVTMTTGDGRQASDRVNFYVSAGENFFPVLESLSIDNGILTAIGSDNDGDSLYFDAYVLSGQILLGKPFNTTEVSAQWKVELSDKFVGSGWEIQVFVGDGTGASDSGKISGAFEPFHLEPDTLYAIATSDRTSAGGNVRVVVATGDTANPFQYVNGCGVVCENGASYASQTFDVGNPDDTPDVGSANPIDGVWGDMGATSFLLAPDNFITGTDLGNGMSRTDFNVTPLGGSDITANGILFSFEYTFASAGTYHLGFEAVNIVSRTYYTDASQSEDFFWSDISNDHQYNVIVVE
ncbi:MAG: hypothetical protein H7A35_10550 [Planctomycetales bacterium]|nr:hypothetical protein [bacterium]UNM07308.1 MAG: hypothetical protein H7A35_10550 [Planctomycetales bacterium]